MSIYYTIADKHDGFGSQYQGIFSGIALCKAENYIYVHTPIKILQHGVDVKKANEFIGIKNNIENYDTNNIIKERFSAKVHWCKTPSIYYTDEVIDYIRNCYYSTEKPNIGLIDIAIHIRRGDVSKTREVGRYIDNKFYAEVIKKLKVKYPVYTITVFSEGKYEDFNDLGLEESCFKLNTDVFESFHSLVSSKVLIIGYSSFSWTAGLINKNIVYHYDSYWHKKLDHWISLSSL